MDGTTSGGRRNPWPVSIAVMISAAMVVLDTTVVNVGLPHIAGSLSATVNEATWGLTSYLAANAVILPIAGWLANYFGRKRLLLADVAGFTLSSAFCGMAPNLPSLIFFRVLQGTTGGGLQPLSQAIMLEEFPLEERGKAMAFWTLGIIAAPILGPTLGGWITDSYSWRWVFYINLAIGIGALQIMLDKGQELDWLSWNFIVTLAITAAVLLPAFVVWELYVLAPIVHFRLMGLLFLAAMPLVWLMRRVREKGEGPVPE